MRKKGAALASFLEVYSISYRRKPSGKKKEESLLPFSPFKWRYRNEVLANRPKTIGPWPHL